MNRTPAFILAVACVAATSLTARAADPQPTMADKASAAAAELKLKARLATICSDCAIVKGTKRETRKGDASGVGAVGGAVAGGVVGNKTTDSTVGGAAVGGLLGHQIEKRVKRTKVWVTTVTMKDGSTRKFEAANDPKWSAGTVVEVDDGKLKKR